MTPFFCRSSNWELYWWSSSRLTSMGSSMEFLGGDVNLLLLPMKNGCWYGREVQAVADCGTS